MDWMSRKKRRRTTYERQMQLDEFEFE